eukprot:6250225-Prymnesium_polylepis.1
MGRNTEQQRDTVRRWVRSGPAYPPMTASTTWSECGRNGHKFARGDERMSCAPPLPSGPRCHLQLWLPMASNASACHWWGCGAAIGRDARAKNERSSNASAKRECKRDCIARDNAILMRVQTSPILMRVQTSPIPMRVQTSPILMR